jgi:hypothetical protein
MITSVCILFLTTNDETTFVQFKYSNIEQNITQVGYSKKSSNTIPTYARKLWHFSEFKLVRTIIVPAITMLVLLDNKLRKGLYSTDPLT